MFVDSFVECVAVDQAVCDEGLSDGPSGANGEPYEDLAEHAKSEEAGGGYCVYLFFLGEFVIEYDAEVSCVVCGGGWGS